MPTVLTQWNSVQFPDQKMTLEILPTAGDARAVSGQFGSSEATTQPIEDDVPATWADWSSGGGASQAVDNVPSGFAYSRNCCTRVPGVVTPTGALRRILLQTTVPCGPCTSSFQANGDTFLCMGRNLLRIAGGTTDGPITTAIFNAPAGQQLYGSAVFKGVGYIGLGPNGLLRKNANNTTNTFGTLPTYFLASVYWVANGISGYRLVATDSTTTFHYVANDPTNAADYTPATPIPSITVGDSSYPINSLVASPRHVYFATSGGLVDVDERGYSATLNPYFALQADDTRNGTVALYHNGFVYVNHVQGLDRVDVSQNGIRQDAAGWCGFGVGISNETPVYGQITAGTIDAGWIVIAYYNGTDSYICYGRPRRTADPSGRRGPLDWHSEVYLPGERVDHLRLTSPSGTYPRMLIATTQNISLEARLYYQYLPRAATPVQEFLNGRSSTGVYAGEYRWSDTAELVQTQQDWGDKAARKTLLRYDVQADNLSTVTYLRVFAQAEGGSFVQQGQGADPKVSRSPRSQLLPTAPLTSGFNVGLKTDFVGPLETDGVGTKAPAILRQLKVRAEVTQEQRDHRTYEFVLGELRSGSTNVIDQRDPDVLWNKLVALQTSDPVRFIDERGNSLLVRVQPRMAWREAQIKRENTTAVQLVRVATVRLALVPQTQAELDLAAGIGSGTLRYDAGLPWDSVLQWPV